MKVDGFFRTLLDSKASLGGIGLFLALGLLAGALALLPRADRGKLRTQLLVLGVHLVLLVAVGFTPAGTTAHSTLSLLALFLLLSVIGRTGFLLVADSVLVRRLARPLPKIIRDITQGLVYVAIILITLRAAGVDPSSLLTTSALLTAVIGLSLQETLGNMFAGLAIQAQQPFQVGDWIQVDESERLVGRVVEINWRATKLVTNEMIELIVPNGAIAKASLRNFSTPTPASRRSVRVQADYEVPPARVHAVILDCLRDMPEVLTEPAPTVVTEDFSDRGVVYWCRFFLQDFERRETIDGLVRDRIWYALAREKIALPYPARVNYQGEAPTAASRAALDARARHREALARVDLLRELPDSSLDELAGLITSRLYAADEIVLRQGELGDELFIVEHGEVVVWLDSTTPGKPPKEVARLGPGAYFGEMSLMTGEARSATVRTLAETELVVVDKAAFQRIVEDTPSILERVSERLAERQAQLRSSAERSIPGVPYVDTESHVMLKKIRRFFGVS